MLSLSAPNTLKQLLNSVNSQFEDYLKREFAQQGIRQQRRNQEVQLDNVLVVDGDNSIELSNLNVNKASLCTLSKFHVDLETFNITLEAKVEQLHLEGDFTEAQYNISAPVLKLGKITFQLEDIAITGNVGIYIVEDSFVTKNYDLNMKWGKIINKVTYSDKKFGNCDVDIEKIFSKYISRQLLNSFFIDEILLNQLSEPMVESSVSELLLDEPEEMRVLSSKRISEVNKISDSVIESMNTFFQTSNKAILETPALNVSIVNKGTSIICTTGTAQLEDLSFKRIGDFSFYENEGIQYIYGSIKLKNFLLKYPSFTIKNETAKGGRIEIEAHRSKFFIKLSLKQENDSVKMAVEKIQALRLLDIDFRPGNLHSLSSHYDQLESHLVASVQGVVFPLLEQRIGEGLLDAIQTKNM